MELVKVWSVLARGKNSWWLQKSSCEHKPGFIRRHKGELTQHCDGLFVSAVQGPETTGTLFASHLEPQVIHICMQLQTAFTWNQNMSAASRRSLIDVFQ